HRRPHRSHQPTDHLPARRQLALDTRTRHRVRPRPPAPAALLNNTTAGPPAAAAPTQPTKSQPPPALTWTSHAPASTQPQQRSEYETEAPTTQHSNRYRTAWVSRPRWMAVRRRCRSLLVSPGPTGFRWRVARFRGCGTGPG